MKTLLKILKVIFIIILTMPLQKAISNYWRLCWLPTDMTRGSLWTQFGLELPLG